MIFQNEKMPFQAIKTSSLKSRKINIFPKGLTYGLGPKMAIIQTFFFQKIQARKMSFMIFQHKKTPFQAIKTSSLKSRKIDIFPTFFFMAIQARKVYFIIFYNEKTLFQAIKKGSSKSGKIDIFSKRLTHGFDPTLAIFPTYFLRQYRLGKCIL